MTKHDDKTTHVKPTTRNTAPADAAAEAIDTVASIELDDVTGGCGSCGCSGRDGSRNARRGWF